MMENINLFYMIEHSKKLNEIFKGKIKLSFVSENSVMIITNNDECYEFRRKATYRLNDNLKAYNSKINTLIEESFVDDLSHKQVNKFKSGQLHKIAGTSDGKVYYLDFNVWGFNTNGILENGKFSSYNPEYNQILFNENVIDICCGADHTLVLTSDGDVYSWGNNHSGQIGNGKSGLNECQSTPFKLNAFNGEKVEGISCGFSHSLALTKSGRVYSWGSNCSGQLGIGNILQYNSPKIVELSKVLDIKKICCGLKHSLLLSRDGDIYVCGSNERGVLSPRVHENILTPIKLIHSEKFIDIASLFNLSFSAAISANFIHYIWGEYGENLITELKKTKFKSFNAIFEHYFLKKFDPLHGKVIPFNNPFIDNAKYEQEFIEMEKLGEGSSGEVFRIKEKVTENMIYAMKKIKLEAMYEKELMHEFSNFIKLQCLEHRNIAGFYDSWLSNDFILKNGVKTYNKNLIFHIQMELCDKPLKEIIDEIKNHSNFFSNETLTPLGYYILSNLFVEILEGVKYLHQRNPPIIHRDLKPENIMLNMKSYFEGFVKIVDMGLATDKLAGLATLKVASPTISDIISSEQSHTIDRGTPKYMAPEVQNFISVEDNTKAQYGTEADIYSLGVTFEELLFIDNDRDYINNENEGTFVNYKYEAAKYLCNEMKRYDPNERPDCQELLEYKHIWAFTEKEANSHIEFKNFWKTNKNNESFVSNLLKRMRFSDLIIQNLKYGREFIDKRTIRVTRYGELIEVIAKFSSQNSFAIKKIKSTTICEKIFKESIVSSLRISELNHVNVLKYFDVWLEQDFNIQTRINTSIQSNPTSIQCTLYIQMELCDISLNVIMDEIQNDSNLSTNGTLTPLGYYIASEIFIQILEGVYYLHQQKPYICLENLNPCKIMLKIEKRSKRFVKIAIPSLLSNNICVNESHAKHRGHNNYVAPEVGNSQMFNKLTDIYSLGAIFQELFIINFESSHSSFSGTNFYYKYDCAKTFCNVMKSDNPLFRIQGECKVLLQAKDKWALTSYEFIENEKTDILNIFKLMENNAFVYKLLSEIFLIDYFVRNGQYAEKFTENRIIGAEGFGEVFEVEETYGSKKIYAIKKIRVTEMNCNKFIRIIKSVPISVIHKNIVEYFEVWLENDFILKNGIKIHDQNLIMHIKMELCDKSLNEIINEIQNDSNLFSNETLTPLGYYIVSEIFIQIIEGVNYLHTRSPPITHGDLNPWNIMLKIEDRSQIIVKIATFNSATLQICLNQSLTQYENHEDFMAPEVKSNKKYDRRADIYSLGTIFKKLFFTEFNRENPVLFVNYKYEELKYLSSQMNSDEPNERPDCQQLLQYKHLWALTAEELKTEIELKNVWKPEEIIESSVLKLLEKRLCFNDLFEKDKFEKVLIEKEEISVNSLIKNFSSDQNSHQLIENMNNNKKQLFDLSLFKIDLDFTTTADMFVLHEYVKECCCVSEADFHLWIGSINNIKRMNFGRIKEWTQRLSVTTDLTLVKNGLKPMKGFANKFTVNQLNPIETEFNIEFTNLNGFRGQFPISEDCKIIATDRSSQFFIIVLPFNQSNQVIGIRPNDGFVSVHSKLSVYNTPKPITHIQTICDNKNNELRHFYNEKENGHLFILGEGGHLLLIDKQREECVLLVGNGGLDLFSLF